jgi:hypothetical protein
MARCKNAPMLYPNLIDTLFELAAADDDETTSNAADELQSVPDPVLASACAFVVACSAMGAAADRLNLPAYTFAMLFEATDRDVSKFYAAIASIGHCDGELPIDATAATLTAHRLAFVTTELLGSRPIDISGPILPAPWSRSEHRFRAEMVRGDKHVDECALCYSDQTLDTMVAWAHVVAGGGRFAPVTVDEADDAVESDAVDHPGDMGWFPLCQQCSEHMPYTHKTIRGDALFGRLCDAGATRIGTDEENT